MKDCKECEFFEGWDYSDGTPCCTNEGGYEECPFNDSTQIRRNGFQINIDSGFLSDYIRHTLQNTIESSARKIASEEIKSIVSAEVKEEVLKETREQIKEVVKQAIDDFMAKEITIGGGWHEPERKLTRTQFLAETIEAELSKNFKSDVIKQTVSQVAKIEIDRREEKLREEINKGVNTYFNEATRQVLTENVVSMLMTNDTYQKLANSMQSLLPAPNNEG